VVCPSATGCLAVGSELVNGASAGVVVKIVDRTPRSPVIVPGTSELNGIACPSGHRCFAVGYAAANRTQQGVAATIPRG
jgi:hypothetical protein